VKVVVNPTWRCQLRCPYCWMHGLGFKPGSEMPARMWLWFLRQLPGPLTVDFSGGEPLLYDGLFTIIEGLIAFPAGWAMTSNLVNKEAVDALIAKRYGNCMGIQVSAHKGGPADLYERAAALAEAGYPVALNVVAHAGARAVPDGMRVNMIPYQAWTEGEAVDGIARQCDAGREHLVMSPDGYVYRCAVEMQLDAPPLGRISNAWTDIQPVEPHECRIGCSTCYTDNPRSWRVAMEAIE